MATIAADGTVLDTWFPAPELSADDDGTGSGTNRLSVAEVTEDLAALAGRDDDRDVETVVVRTTIASLDDKPADAFDAYLRLHLLSHRLIAPHGANMDGVFGVLANVVWTSYGPCAVDGFELDPGAAAAARPGRGVRHRQVPPHGRLRGAHRASGSPTPTGCASARTLRRAPRSCTRAS